MKQCLHKDCTLTPVFQVGFRGWPRGAPRHVVKPVLTFTQHCVCDIHRNTVKVQDFIDLPNQVKFTISMIKNGRQPIDFSTAEVVFTPLTEAGALNVKPAKRGLPSPLPMRMPRV